MFLKNLIATVFLGLILCASAFADTHEVQGNCERTITPSDLRDTWAWCNSTDDDDELLRCSELNDDSVTSVDFQTILEFAQAQRKVELTGRLAEKLSGDQAVLVHRARTCDSALEYQERQGGIVVPFAVSNVRQVEDQMLYDLDRRGCSVWAKDYETAYTSNLVADIFRRPPVGVIVSLR